MSQPPARTIAVAATAIVLAVIPGAPLGAEAPAAAWIRHYNGPHSLHDTGAKIALGPAGTVTIVGISESASTQDDIATVRYDADGNELWVARYNNTATNWIDVPADLSVDDVGNTFVVGETWNGSNWDWAVVKYAPDGTTAWEKKFNGPGNLDDTPYAVVADEQGGAFVAGYAFKEPGSQTFFARHFYVARYDAAGTVVWEVYHDAPEHHGAGAQDLRVAPDGNLVATGWIDVSGTTLSLDVLTMKVTPDGQVLWIRQWDSGGIYREDDEGKLVRTDRFGNVYVLGWHSSDDFANGLESTLLRYSPDGDLEWVASMDFIRPDGFAEMVDDEAGNLYLAGGWNNQMDSDGFAVSFGPDGQERWRYVFDGPNDWDFQEALSILRGPDGLLYVGLDYQHPDAAGYDYTIAVMDTDGNFLDLWRYDTGDGSDTFYSLGGWAMDDAGNIFIGAYSGSATQGANYTTVKVASGASCTTPDEVTGVQHDADKITLSWLPQGTGYSYDVARGTLDELGSVPALCLATSVTGTSLGDADVPPPGISYYYLVRSGNGCAVGPWGSGGEAEARVTSCP